jgi:hypothetical protein
MNAFLTSARGVLDVLLQEYAGEYNIKMKHVKKTTFKERAIKEKNISALQFLDWYDSAYQAMEKDKEIGFLFVRRNEAVHTAKNMMQPPLWITNAAPIMKVVNEDGQIEYRSDPPIILKESWEASNGDMMAAKDVREVCELFLVAIESIVLEAHGKFPFRWDNET